MPDRTFKDLDHLSGDDYRREANKRKMAGHRRSGAAFTKSAYFRQHRYGITPEEYDRRVKEQDGKCAICLEERPLAVDHCHETGKVRGLLCRSCNAGMGMLKDDPERLRRAILFLEQ